jgi:phosphoglycolate phosphatase
VKALIFDFDGTIVDSFEASLSIFYEITHRQKLTSQEVKSLRGKSLREVIKFLKIKSWQIPRLILRAKSLMAAKIATLKTFEGMPKTLEQLHQDGHQMFILSTNSSDNISHFLKNNGLDGCFHKIYGDIGLRSKSSALKKIMSKENINRSSCAYIGDEVRDVEAAKKAGVMSVAVGWGFNTPEALQKARPSAIAKTPKDLLDFFSAFKSD